MQSPETASPSAIRQEDRMDVRASRVTRGRRWVYFVVLAVAAIVYIGGVLSPPSLMDDVDAVQAQIARNMIDSGDWVTPRIDGIVDLEKPPFIYWSIVASYKVFGVHDWAARIPLALFCIALCWVTAAFGSWAFGDSAGLYAGLCMATCAGLFLFTRFLIPDAMLSFTIALGLWALMRVLDEEELRPRLWATVLAACLGAGLLMKSLVGVLFPVATGSLYLAFTRQLVSARTWKRLHPFSGILIILAIAAPWHVLAILRNPPYFDFTLRSVPGEYHGFFWFFFINEQLLRFLNLRYPRDYNTVPRLAFWLLNLAWMFPWSVYFPSIVKLSFRPSDRAGRTRLLCLCWAGFLMIFFTFSTTQEYYSMPIYAAFALLVGSAMDSEERWIRGGTRVLGVLAAAGALAIFAVLFVVRGVPTPGDISSALTNNPDAYTLSLGHMEDLTFRSLAYLRVPLLVAGFAFLIGTVGSLFCSGRRVFVGATLMMVLFLYAARLALVVFDPYMSSRPIAEALKRAPAGDLIVDRHYEPSSSVFFYADRTGLLLNGRVDNMVYGSCAPGAPDIFLDDLRFKELWLRPKRWYLVTPKADLPRFEELVGSESLHVVQESGGKLLLTNQPR